MGENNEYGFWDKKVIRYVPDTSSPFRSNRPLGIASRNADRVGDFKAWLVLDVVSQIEIIRPKSMMKRDIVNSCISEVSKEEMS